MSWVRNLLIGTLIILGIAAVERAPNQPEPILFVPAHAQDACTPNPNAIGPPFVNGCPMPASALTNIVGGAQAIGAAVCDGATDNTSVFQTALNTAGAAGGGTVIVPGGTCNISGTLAVSNTGVHIIGQGTAATIVNFTGTGTGDGFQLGTFPNVANCVGVSQPSNCQQVFDLSIEKLSAYAQHRTGGFLFDLYGASQVFIRDIQFTGYDVLKTDFVNNVILSNVAGYTSDTANFSAYLYNQITTGTTNGWYRSDVITFNDVVINNNRNGARCIEWDGAVFTVRIKHMGLLGCTYGLAVDNSQLSSSFYPQFLTANDLEIDGGTNTAVSISAGSDFNFVNPNINSINATGSVVVFSVTPDSSHSITRGVTVVGGSIHDGPNSSAFLGGQNIQISGVEMFDTNHTATGTRPTVEIGSAAVDVQITGSFLGQRFGDPDAPNYGVVVDSGATAVSLVGNDSHGATTDGVDNLSSAAVSYVGGITNGGVANTANTCAATSVCP